MIISLSETLQLGHIVHYYKYTLPFTIVYCKFTVTQATSKNIQRFLRCAGHHHVKKNLLKPNSMCVGFKITFGLKKQI